LTARREKPDALWSTLVDEDAVQAYQALGTLVAAGDPAVSVAKRTPQEIARLMHELDSNDFAVREKAGQTLEPVGETALVALRTTLAKKPSLEVKRRIEPLLTTMEPNVFRTLRAVEVLEPIGSSEPMKVLRALATGAAKASLARLNKRTAEVSFQAPGVQECVPKDEVRMPCDFPPRCFALESVAQEEWSASS
jgi:hypothetical protein